MTTTTTTATAKMPVTDDVVMVTPLEVC